MLSSGLAKNMLLYIVGEGTVHGSNATKSYVALSFNKPNFDGTLPVGSEPTSSSYKRVGIGSTDSNSISTNYFLNTDVKIVTEGITWINSVTREIVETPEDPEHPGEGIMLSDKNYVYIKNSTEIHFNECLEGTGDWTPIDEETQIRRPLTHFAIYDALTGTSNCKYFGELVAPITVLENSVPIIRAGALKIVIE